MPYEFNIYENKEIDSFFFKKGKPCLTTCFIPPKKDWLKSHLQFLNREEKLFLHQLCIIYHTP